MFERVYWWGRDRFVELRKKEGLVGAEDLSRHEEEFLAGRVMFSSRDKRVGAEIGR